MIYKLIKKFYRSLFALLIIFGSFASCYDSGYEEYVPPTGNVNDIQPTTLFTATTNAADNLGVIFRSYSTDAASYLWDFGDGNTSTEANPDYVYTIGGLYQVKLTTTSAEGLIGKDSTNVAPIFVDYSFTSIDSQVTFTNNTEGAASLVWDFGDGESVSWEVADTQTDSDFSPIHTYDTADVFDVTLTVTNFLGREVTLTKKVEGLVLAAIPDFSFSSNGLRAEFTDESLLAESYSWDFGDGSTSTEKDPVHIYPSNDTYNVTLTIKNSANVERSITKAIAIGGVKPTFEAKIIAGDFDRGIWDNIQNPWAINPDNSSDFDFWDNISLESVVQSLSGGSDKGSSSGTSNLTPDSLKFDKDSKRAYQPINVEVGVEYEITGYVKNKSANDGDLVGTFYVLPYEPENESIILTDNLVEHKVYASSTGTWDKAFMEFKASSVFSFGQDKVDIQDDDLLTSVDQKWVILYFVPNLTTAGEVNLDDVSIVTLGF